MRMIRPIDSPKEPDRFCAPFYPVFETFGHPEIHEGFTQRKFWKLVVLNKEGVMHNLLKILNMCNI